MTNFLQWINEEQQKPEGSALAEGDPKMIRTARTRSRLTRIEAMLAELLNRRMNNASENRS